MLNFDSIPENFPNATAPTTFTARDGTALPYRYYPANASAILILLHGSGTHSLYLSDLAAGIAASGMASVYTPGLRGHGDHPKRRGDIDYIGQLEDDIADLIAKIRHDNPEATIILGGHSSGGGLAIRFAGSPTSIRPDGYLFLAPFLQYNAPTMRPKSGGWAYPKYTKIILLSLLNRLCITIFNSVTAITFNLPLNRRTGNETLSYSYRLMKSISPGDYRKALQQICEPALLLVGSEDEAFYAKKFIPIFEKFAPRVKVIVIPGVGHLDLVQERYTLQNIVIWLSKLPGYTRE